ncbi:MAG: aminotransferase class III-fold pyridoxal phosphate-dependent enzyme [Bilophila wadsworthia]
MECIQGTGGYVVPPDGYYPRLKKVLDERKIMLVDDEIQMGFYRTGKLWGLQNFGITPDVVVFGKAMTNGLNPLAGIWAKERYINPQAFPAAPRTDLASNPRHGGGPRNHADAGGRGHETRVREMGAYFLRPARAEVPLRHHRRRGRPRPCPARRNLRGGRLHPRQGHDGPHRGRGHQGRPHGRRQAVRPCP